VQHDKTQALTESAIAEYGGVSEMPSGFNPIKALQTVAVRKSPNPERTPTVSCRRNSNGWCGKKRPGSGATP